MCILHRTCRPCFHQQQINGSKFPWVQFHAVQDTVCECTRAYKHVHSSQWYYMRLYIYMTLLHKCTTCTMHTWCTLYFTDRTCSFYILVGTYTAKLCHNFNANFNTNLKQTLSTSENSSTHTESENKNITPLTLVPIHYYFWYSRTRRCLVVQKKLWSCRQISGEWKMVSLQNTNIRYNIYTSLYILRRPHL